MCQSQVKVSQWCKKRQNSKCVNVGIKCPTGLDLMLCIPTYLLQFNLSY